MAQTPPGPRQDIETTRRQHETLAMGALTRIKRYADADLKEGRPSLEHAEMILAAAWVYAKGALAAGKDAECAARHPACGETAARETAA
jgi:hypothetical protein